MDKFIKRLQTRVNRIDGVRVTKSQVREIYTELVSDADNPLDDEINAVADLLVERHKQTPVEPEKKLATASVVNHELQSDQSIHVETPAPSDGALATSEASTIAQSSNSSASLTQTAIKDAVEQQFGSENQQTKQAILNYVAQDTFATAQELQTALTRLRSMRLDILLKLIADHNQASSDDESVLKQALLNATTKRERETQDFFGNFDKQLVAMRATFGI